MSQCSQFNNLIKKMAVNEPALKLLCHFDDNTTDSSYYRRPAIIAATVGYKSGNYLSKFGKAAYALGNSGSGRHDGYIAYDISDVNLSGQFCIDYWFRNYGSYSYHFPMLLIPLGVTDPINYNRDDSPLHHLDSNSTSTRGFYTYDPTTQTQQLCKLSRNTQVNHIAVTRDADNVLRWFYNGTLKASYTNNYDFTSKEIHVARTYSNGTGAYLLVDELRVVSGEPCYTENFTPPTEPYIVS